MTALIAAALAALLLAACGDKPPPPDLSPATQAVAPAAGAVPGMAQPAPVVVQQPSGNDGMLTGALIGGALGYMAGSRNQPRTETRVIERRYSAPPPPPMPAAIAPAHTPRPALTPPASKPTWTATARPAKPSAPTWSASSRPSRPTWSSSSRPSSSRK